MYWVVGTRSGFFLKWAQFILSRQFKQVNQPAISNALLICSQKLARWTQKSDEPAISQSVTSYPRIGIL
jgi:hypothetical protein